MTPDQVLSEFAKAGALLKGHFILSSGLRSDTFLQKALVFQDPKRTAKLARPSPPRSATRSATRGWTRSFRRPSARSFPATKSPARWGFPLCTSSGRTAHSHCAAASS